LPAAEASWCALDIDIIGTFGGLAGSGGKLGGFQEIGVNDEMKQVPPFAASCYSRG
jgi:hypothetical protein